MRRQDETIQHLIEEIARSVMVHGGWEGYGEEEILEAVGAEFREYQSAYFASDIDGPHGQRAELLQLATVAVKGFIRLGDRERMPAVCVHLDDGQCLQRGGTCGGCH